MSSSNGSTTAAATSLSLLARVRANDAEAWDRLIALYAPFVHRTCRQARLGSEDAADVFQEVFQAAFSRIESFEKHAAGGTFRGWLRAITRNKVHDHFRRQEREPRAAGGTEIQIRMAQVRAPEPSASSNDATHDGPDVVDILAELHLFHDALQGIRDRFHERTWKAFLGTVVDGRTPADVGEDLAMSPGAVRVAKSRVLSCLRTELGDLPP